MIAPGLNCSDSDAAIRALLDHCLSIHDLEIPGAGLEAAILQLTADFRERQRSLLSEMELLLDQVESVRVEVSVTNRCRELLERLYAELRQAAADRDAEQLRRCGAK